MHTHTRTQAESFHEGVRQPLVDILPELHEERREVCCIPLTCFRFLLKFHRLLICVVATTENRHGK